MWGILFTVFHELISFVRTTIKNVSALPPTLARGTRAYRATVPRGARTWAPQDVELLMGAFGLRHAK